MPKDYDYCFTKKPDNEEPYVVCVKSKSKSKSKSESESESKPTPGIGTTRFFNKPPEPKKELKKPKPIDINKIQAKIQAAPRTNVYPRLGGINSANFVDRTVYTEANGDEYAMVYKIRMGAQEPVKVPLYALRKQELLYLGIDPAKYGK